MAALLKKLAVPQVRRRWGLIAALTGVVGLGVGAVAFRASSSDPACDGDPMRGTWTVATRAAVHMRLGDASERTLPRLDGYARDWSRAWADTCSDDAGGELVVAERRACLVGQLRRFHRTLEGFIDTSLDLHGLVASIPLLTSCEQGRVGVVAALPEDPDTRAAVIELRDRIADAQLRQAFGEYTDVAAEIDGIVEAARALEFAPLLAEALVLRGQQASYMREPDARTRLREAIAAATAAGNDVLAIEAWITLARDSAEAQGDFDGALADLGLAQAVLDANPRCPTRARCEPSSRTNAGSCWLKPETSRRPRTR